MTDKKVVAAIRNSIREIVELINDQGIKQEDIVQIFKEPSQCTILYYVEDDTETGD